MTKKKKFTIIELLAVIAIISILAGLTLPALNNARNNANKIININKLKNIATAITIYKNNNNSYPSISSLQDDYLPRETLLDFNGQLFVIEPGISVDSGVADAVIIDSSISGFTNILYADGHVTSRRN